MLDGSAEADQASTADASPHQVEVFRLPAEADVVGLRGRGRDADTTSRHGQILRSLERSGMNRPLVQPHEGWHGMLSELERTMPNFGAVTREIVGPHLTMLQRGVLHRRPPILLLGTPGVGKTHYARKLATIMGFAQALFVSVSAETNGSALAGSSVFWSNSSPGQRFEALAWGASVGRPAANPVVVLDEIDKSAGDQRYDPLGALYTQLEQNTARDFQDQSVPDVYIDATNVRFIATANDAKGIPAALRSRLVCYEIPPPSREQLRSMAQGICLSLIEQYKLPFERELPQDIAERVLELPPREMKVAIDIAISKAAARESWALEAKDWVAVAPSGQAAGLRRIGF